MATVFFNKVLAVYRLRYETNFYKKGRHENSGSWFNAGGRYIIIHLFPNAHTAFHRHVLFDRLL